MFKGFVNFYNKIKGEGDEIRQSFNNCQEHSTSKLKGKMIKDYTLQDTITFFQNPYSQLVSGLKQNNKKVSIYAIQKKYITQEYFVLYQNSIAQNCDNLSPKFLQSVQSANFIYLIFDQVNIPQKNMWNISELVDQIVNISKKIGILINQKGLLINQQKNLVYLQAYQHVRAISKFQYDSKNRAILADFFCKMVFTQQQKDINQIRQLIINNLGNKSLKQQLIKIIKLQNQNNQKRTFAFQKNSNLSPLFQSKISNLSVNNDDKLIKTPLINNSQNFYNYFIAIKNDNNQININNQYSSHPLKNKNNIQHQSQEYPYLTEDEQQIQKLLQVVKVNPSLINQANQYYAMRASSRNRNQNKEQTKQIDNIIDNTKRSLFQIKVIKSTVNLKSKFIIESNKKKQEENQFQLYLASYMQIFKHCKKTMKSGLKYYQKGYSGIILAYFITLIGILRRSKLAYAIQFQEDFFGIGCKSVNIQKHISKIKKDLFYEAKILTDLRQTIFRCYIPVKTMDIMNPFLNDRIEQINSVKLEDFCFFYMSSLIKDKVDKNTHFINFIEFMYIILNRNFEIVHFQTETPRIWDESFFLLRKELIKSIIPGWKI